MTVREATRADAEAMAQVHCESFTAAYGRARDPERTQQEWRAAFDRPEVSKFVALDQGTIVGVLSLGPARDDSGDGELYVLYVLPDRWGSAAGQLLIDRAHSELAHGYDEGMLTVLAENPRARRFYERNGWMLDAVRTELHFGGEPTVVARYCKTFAAG